MIGFNHTRPHQALGDLTPLAGGRQLLLPHQAEQDPAVVEGNVGDGRFWRDVYLCRLKEKESERYQ
jgi:hypothetical protein